MNVQLILSDDVPNLGSAGDVVRVRAGYARNYLIPQQLAIEANPRNLRVFEHQKRLVLQRRETLKGEAMGLRERIEQLSLVVTARAGEEGRLFGSVTNLDIERALREQGVTVERRRIMLEEPIKQLGEFTVPVRLSAEVQATLRLTVAAA